MPDFQPPQWSEFKVPGGGADLSYVGPVANAYASAAEMATKPLNRMLEQVLSSRLQEKATLQQQQYAAQQQSRAFQDQTMRDRLNDAAALDRINVEYDRRAEMERIAQEEKARQAQILTSTFWGGGQAMASPAGGVAPGTGALRFEDVYGAGPQEGFAPPPPGLDPSQIGTVYNAQAIRAERNQNNAEQAAKDARAQATAQAQMQAVGTTIAQAPIPPDVKAALMARVQGGDPDGAAGQLADFLKPAPPRQKTASELENDKLDRFETNFGGGIIYLPNSLAKGSDAYIKANGALSKLPADGKAALTLQAQEIVNKTIRATDPVMAAVLDGTMTTKDEKLKAAIKASYDSRVNEQIPLLAQTLGWKTDEQLLAEGMAASTERQAAAQVTPTPPPPSEPPTVDGMRRDLGEVQRRIGMLPEEVSALNADAELVRLLKAGKREDARKILQDRYDKRMSDSAKQGWTEPPAPPPTPLDRWTHGPG